MESYNYAQHLVKFDQLGQNLVKQRNDPQSLWLELSNLVYSRTKLKRSYETPEKEAVSPRALSPKLDKRLSDRKVPADI